MELYSVMIEEATHLSPACLFSADPISKNVVKKLRFAQEVIEAQWLAESNPTPCFVMMLPAKVGTTLFDDVSLINPDDWNEMIDQSETILLNESMFDLCKADDGLFLKLKYHNAEQLSLLFEDNMFVVAGVY